MGKDFVTDRSRILPLTHNAIDSGFFTLKIYLRNLVCGIDRRMLKFSVLPAVDLGFVRFVTELVISIFFSVCFQDSAMNFSTALS